MPPEIWYIAIVSAITLGVGYACYRGGVADGRDAEKIKHIVSRPAPSRVVANLTRWNDNEGHPHYAVSVGCAGVKSEDHDARWLSTGQLTREDAIAQVKEDFPHASITDLTGDKDGSGLPRKLGPAHAQRNPTTEPITKHAP